MQRINEMSHRSTRPTFASIPIVDSVAMQSRVRSGSTISDCKPKSRQAGTKTLMASRVEIELFSHVWGRKRYE